MGERILIVDKDSIMRALLTQNLEKWGHEVTGEAESSAQVKALLESGLDFTAAIVDPNIVGTGKAAAELIKKTRSLVKVVSYGDEVQDWGDVKLQKGKPSEELRRGLESL